MEIRKIFKFNGVHIVRNCSSERCKKSIHAHTYTVELFFEADTLDNGQMVLDFGLMKGPIKDIIKSFDGTYSLWIKEDKDFKEMIYKNYERVITTPMSPSAESYSIMILNLVEGIINATQFNNGEGEIKLSKVRVHETRTGYAEASREEALGKVLLTDFDYSDEVIESWNDHEFMDKTIEYCIQSARGVHIDKPFINIAPEMQIK